MDRSKDMPPTGKIPWLWKQIEKARDAGDAAVEREGLERLIADSTVRGTSDEDLALLGLSRLDLAEGRALEVSKRLSAFEWHGIPGPAALLLFSDICLRLDWFARARESLEEYMRSFPEDLDARRKLGLVMLMLDEDAEAERILLATARREQNGVPATLSYLALLEAKRGRLEESLHLMLQARDLAPFDARIEHSLLSIEALRVRMKRGTVARDDLPLKDLVPAMAAGMLQLHGFGRERADAAIDLWARFSAGARPTGRKPAIWAAALEYLVTRSGPHFTQDQLAADYGISVTQLREHLQEMEAAFGPEVLQYTDLLQDAARDGLELAVSIRQSGAVDVLSELASRAAEFASAGDAADWVLERYSPASDRERREVADFVAWMWRRRSSGLRQ
jgi:tetratricopeptide (TPR) repeat protein